MAADQQTGRAGYEQPGGGFVVAVGVGDGLGALGEPTALPAVGVEQRQVVRLGVALDAHAARGVDQWDPAAVAARPPGTRRSSSASATGNDQNLWMASEKGEPSRRMI